MYRIYIIEDEEAIASAIKNNLEKWGFEVKCAEDFRSITEEFSAFSPQLVLMDLLTRSTTSRMQQYDSFTYIF